MGGKGGTQGPLDALPSQVTDLAPATTTAIIYMTTKHPKRGYSYHVWNVLKLQDVHRFCKTQYGKEKEKYSVSICKY